MLYSPFHLETLFDRHKTKVEQQNNYPGWSYALSKPLQTIYTANCSSNRFNSKLSEMVNCTHFCYIEHVLPWFIDPLEIRHTNVLI